VHKRGKTFNTIPAYAFRAPARGYCKNARSILYNEKRPFVSEVTRFLTLSTGLTTTTGSIHK
jgi:hypothetical protein